MVRLGMQIAFGRVHRKTAPTGPWVQAVGNADRIWTSTPQNLTYRAWGEKWNTSLLSLRTFYPLLTRHTVYLSGIVF